MTASEQPFEQRLAADLRTLADFVENNPALGQEVSHVIRQLTVVVPGGIGLSIDDFDGPLTEAGATEVHSDFDEEHWIVRAWRLPAGLVTVTATAMRWGTS